ncbi:GIY-YIG nuclease family protein [Frigoribacterium sp. MCBA15_019]|uniref:GIY-YIG nuclease family protein n=1 Tax=Frigoribacterium sp. MCBA15_019 TaxID=1898745 RepID=UPI0008DE4AB9|nr:GIY-YIG nuclease family protein [Frigoribacterium sp. MCBA15_019]OII27314.1 hypothetical protein BIV04_01775 [Frigoribacterium sp. MCBA15_019]
MKPADARRARNATPLAEHFGETLTRSKFGHRMTRAMYGYPSRVPHSRVRRESVSDEFWEGVAWAYRDDEHRRHSDLYLLVQRDEALRNYDLSMTYFEALRTKEFEEALQRVLASAPSLQQVDALPNWHEAEGVYVMVFDDIKQFYVGRASDIRRRIRSHWSGRKSFDRLVWGSIYSSILPVDELRALDNTRIFAVKRRRHDLLEAQVEAAGDQVYMLNRIRGGALSPIELLLAAGSPRHRPHHMTARGATPGDLNAVEQDVDQRITDSRADGAEAVAASLSTLDMSIRSGVRPDGSLFLWSARDFIADAARRSTLTIPEYSAFLARMGETIVWPEE